MDLSKAATEILSGFTISMLMIPEAFSFSKIVGLEPQAGMNSTMIMSFITSLLTGQPGMISGATGSVATSLMGVTKNFGKEYIAIVALMGGVIQLLIGGTGMTKYFDKIPRPVLSGFLVGLAILIFQGQIQYFKDKDGQWIAGKKLAWTIGLIGLGVVVARVSEKFQNRIPGALIGVAAVALVAHLTKAPVMQIGDAGDVKSGLPKFEVPKVEWNRETFMKLLPWAIGMAIVGLIESQVMLKEAGKIIGRPGNPLKETLAQGVANIATGFGKGMGGCVLVGQSKLNYAHGASTRLSSMATSLSFGALVIFLSKFINKVPMPALMAIMMEIVVRTGDWGSLMGGMNKNTLVTFLTVITAVFGQNLALGVGAGTLTNYLIHM